MNKYTLENSGASFGQARQGEVRIMEALKFCYRKSGREVNTEYSGLREQCFLCVSRVKKTTNHKAPEEIYKLGRQAKQTKFEAYFTKQ